MKKTFEWRNWKFVRDGEAVTASHRASMLSLPFSYVNDAEWNLMKVFPMRFVPYVCCNHANQIVRWCEHGLTNIEVWCPAGDDHYTPHVPVTTLARSEASRALAGYGRLQFGDLVGVNPAPNSHGCRDYGLARYVGMGRFVIVEAETCLSCWQVGHAEPRTFLGEGWIITPTWRALRGASDSWATNVKWEVDAFDVSLTF